MEFCALEINCILPTIKDLKDYSNCNFKYMDNGTARFKNCKQLFEYKHLLLLRDIWWSKL